MTPLPTPNDPHSQADVDKLLELARQAQQPELPFIEPPLVLPVRYTQQADHFGLPISLAIVLLLSSVTLVGIAIGRLIVYFHLFGF